MNKRLLAVDILRGITIAGMLLVNNPGTWSSIYAPLEHAEWIGLTPTDLVFPFFVFVMGVSMYFSLRKFEFKPSGKLLWKITRRALILFFIAWLVAWFGRALRLIFVSGYEFKWFEGLRILGVFQRLALVYFFGSLIAIFFKQKFIPWIIGLILVAYAVILGLGHGYEFSTANILSRVDLALLGDDHMYHEGAYGMSIALDPEGVLSTLPCIAHVLIGFMVGKLLTDHRDNNERVKRVAILGISLLLAGWLLQYGIPCGKKAWTSTYVLITTGMASCILALLVYVIDIKGRDRWCRFFQSFGINPLFCYLVGTVLSICFGVIWFWHSSDYQKADKAKAIELYTQAANDSVPEAMNNLAVAYCNGKDVAADTAKAVTLFEQAADKGVANAKFNLAVIKMKQGDNKKALATMQELADSAFTPAVLNMGLAYDYGLLGLKANHDKAREYYALAAKDGSERAVMALNMGQGKEGGLTEAFSVADDLLSTSLKTYEAVEGESGDKALATYNKALETSQNKGDTYTPHKLLFDGCEAITTSTKAASLLYAITFVLICWLLGFILYKKKIYIKI